MENIGFFEGVVKSFYSFKDYPRFVKNSGGKTFLYMLFLVLIMLLADAFISAKIKGFVTDLFNSGDIPRWELNAEDGTISVEKKYIISGNRVSMTELDSYPEEIEGNTFIAVDTDSDFYLDREAGTILVYDYITDSLLTEMAFSESYSSQIALVGRSSVIMLNKGQLQELPFSELEPDVAKVLSFENVMNFMKDSLVKIIFVIMAIYSIVAVLFGCLVQAVIAAVQNSGKTGLKFGSLFKMSVHARTIPTVLCVIVMIVGIPAGWLWLINYIIGAVFIHFAIKEYKAYTESLEIDRTAELNSINASNTLNPMDYNTPFNNAGGGVASYNAGAASDLSSDGAGGASDMQQSDTSASSPNVGGYGYGMGFGSNSQDENDR